MLTANSSLRRTAFKSVTATLLSLTKTVLAKKGESLKEVEWKLLSELMKNSRRSDRVLARAINTSQPTVTRTRGRLERQGFIKEYTIVPDFTKIGFEIMAFTFLKWARNMSAEDFQKMIDASREKYKKGSMSIIMVVRGLGNDYDAIMVSLHEDFAAYRNLVDTVKRLSLSDVLTCETFMVDLTDVTGYRPLTFSCLAEYLQVCKEKMRKRKAK